MVGGTSSDGVSAGDQSICDTHPVDSAANCSRHRRTNGWDPAVVNRSRWKGWDGYCVPMVRHGPWRLFSAASKRLVFSRQVPDDYEPYMLKCALSLNTCSLGNPWMCKLAQG